MGPPKAGRQTTLSHLSIPAHLIAPHPGGSDGKNMPAMQETPGSIPGWGRSPGGGNGKPLQHSCLENPMDRGVWQGYSPWSRKEADTTEHSPAQ